MTNPTLKRAARAVQDILSAEDCHSAPEAETIARAVLMAVRIPDNDMVEAGIAAWPFEHDAPFTAAYRMHTAMIDAILGENDDPV